LRLTLRPVLAAVAWAAATCCPTMAMADTPASIDVQVIAVNTDAANTVAMVLMVTGTGLTPTDMLRSSDRCDGVGYDQTGSDGFGQACYRITVVEDLEPVSGLSYEQLFKHGTTSFLLLHYRTPIEPPYARSVRIDISFKLWNDVVRNPHPETDTDLTGFPEEAFPDPGNPWAPIYTYQDRRLNALYDGLTASPRVTGDRALRMLIAKAEQNWVALKQADCSAALLADQTQIDRCRVQRTVNRIDQLQALRQTLAGPSKPVTP
jgi:hypothetical protein